MSNLDLALVGNARIGVLLDALGTVVWGCFPRFDSDATFCSLLDAPMQAARHGYWAMELVDGQRHEQSYVRNTPVLVTKVFDAQGGAIEITDFAPRFRQHGRIFCPMMLVRRVRRIAGQPRLRVRLRPAHGWGAHAAEVTPGTHHLRYLTPALSLRLTTDASISAVEQELAFVLEDEANFVFGPDETLQESIAFAVNRFLHETISYWQDWVSNLAIPYEWQSAVIRAAITLKLNTYDDSGAIIAALTTSIPESAHSGRTWDYRYCWLRDAYFVINALNRLSATRTMERYLAFIVNLTANAHDMRLQPVYRIDGRANLDERIIDTLPGYRGMGPVRIGNQARLQVQNDVYGSAILAATHVFFDERLHRCGDRALFERLEALGEQAKIAYQTPDAGLWELRGSQHVHTFSSVMCWVACDRLARIAARLGLTARAAYWSGHAAEMQSVILRRAWNERLQCFTSSFEGDGVDASLLLMPELRILPAQDARFVATLKRIEKELKIGDFIFRYKERDDFGEPNNAFLICTFWYIDALAAVGRREEARALFEKMLACRTRLGLLAEHIDPQTRELWGNFVQTYSMVGLINSAVRLSVPWEEVV